jgi:hypothetical protein
MSKQTVWRVIVISALLLLVAPGVLQAAPPAQEEQVYTVGLADSLWSLAEKYLGNGAAFPAIVAATNEKAAEDASFAEIEDAGVIQPGWKILIPSAEDAAAYMEEYAPRQPPPGLWYGPSRQKAGALTPISMTTTTTRTYSARFSSP